MSHNKLIPIANIKIGSKVKYNGIVYIYLGITYHEYARLQDIAGNITEHPYDIKVQRV